MPVQHSATVLEHTPLGNGKRTLLRTSIANSFQYNPGQYTIINLKDGEPDIESLARYASIASAPHETSLLFIMNQGSSEFKQRYLQLKKGANILLTTPESSLFTPNSSKTSVFLAGGVGVTPIRSILLHLHHTGLQTPTYLFYSARSPQDCLFYDEFRGLDTSNPDFHFTPTLTRAKAIANTYNRWIDALMIQNHIKEDSSDAHYHIVGSHAFIRSMQNNLREMNIVPTQWSIEVFCGYCPDHACCCDHVRH